MNVRILAIDQGSVSCGFAYLDDDRVVDTDVLRPKASMPWAERMDYIAEQLVRGSRTRGWIPDVVGIESVVFAKNVRTALSMGETRGYLKRVVRELYPRARLVDVSPSETKAAVGAGRDRDGAKRRTELVVSSMTGLNGLREDEYDAVAIGWAVLTRLRRERLEHSADPGEQTAMTT